MKALAIVMLLTTVAQAETLHQWYVKQYTPGGGNCCAEADAHDYYNNYTLNNDGSITLADGHRIPANMVLHDPNPTGHAIYWYAFDGKGGIVDHCFAIGPLN